MAFVGRHQQKLRGVPPAREDGGRMSGAATCFLAAVVLIATGSSGLAEAGSTGGTIGKTEKSVSGGERSSEPQSRTNSRPISKGSGGASSADRSSQSSIAGRWRYSADCTVGHWQGEFEILQGSGGSFSGSFAGTSLADTGTISNGRVSGSSISFTRTSSVATQYWRGGIAGGRMSGTSSGNANCSWQALRK